MNIVVVGATGSIGRHVVNEALAAGYRVRALVRDVERLAEDPQIEVVVGDITDAAAVGRAVDGTDAVVWAVGPSRNAAEQVPIFESGARNLVAAMQEHGVRRLVALSGAGITVEGERKPLAGRLMSVLVRIAARHVVEAKRREYEVFKASDLDWTLVRPPRVVEGPPTGRALAAAELRGSRVTAGDVARVMVGQLDDPTCIRGAPFVSS